MGKEYSTTCLIVLFPLSAALNILSSPFQQCILFPCKPFQQTFTLTPSHFRAQASAVKLKDMQSLHAEVSKVATETQKTNEELAWAKEKLNREMERVKEDLEEVKTDLVTTESDRDSALEELKTIQQLLYISKETEVCVCV